MKATIASRGTADVDVAKVVFPGTAHPDKAVGRVVGTNDMAGEGAACQARLQIGQRVSILFSPHLFDSSGHGRSGDYSVG